MPLPPHAYLWQVIFEANGGVERRFSSQPVYCPSLWCRRCCRCCHRLCRLGLGGLAVRAAFVPGMLFMMACILHSCTDHKIGFWQAHTHMAGRQSLHHSRKPRTRLGAHKADLMCKTHRRRSAARMPCASCSSCCHAASTLSLAHRSSDSTRLYRSGQRYPVAPPGCLLFLPMLLPGCCPRGIRVQLIKCTWVVD